ncbi:MAG: hypothetical protein M3Y54_01920 [Bacteroidota bacterium]|nr:hypothetical protein [Bacteroidota bacterium]
MKPFSFLLLAATLLATRPAAQAQTANTNPAPEPPIYPAPEGVWVVISGSALNPDKPTGRLVGARIFRADAGSNSYQEVGQIKEAATLADFRTVAGPESVQALKAAQKLASDEAAWSFIQAHPNVQAYGLQALNMPFRQALGTAFLDASARDARPGTRFTYRVQPIYATAELNKQAEGKFFEKTVEMGRLTPLPRPHTAHVRGLDSVITVRWAARAQPASAVLTTVFGRVWRQGPGERSFTAQPARLLATREGDSLYFNFDDRVRPESLFRYYVQPLDFVGNPGPGSDTTYVLSVDPRRTALLHGVSARDTIAGIALSWPALPAKGYWAGIEIQRSRDARGSYVRLDTIPATATGYLDTRLLPNVAYHYRLRALLLDGRAPDLASASATASHTPTAAGPPLPPVALTGEPEGPNVRLRWQPAAPDLNHDAYFVYRGTARQDSLVVVSPALHGDVLTYLDTTAANGRRQYTYVVQAVNKNNQASPFSESVSVQPHRAMSVAAPFGLSGYADGPALRLSWDDAARRDAAVVAYHLYRRPATATTGQAGFQRLTVNAVRGASYTDEGRPGDAWQYAVAAVDALGTESPWSPIATVRVPAAPLTPPSRVNARPVPTGVELSWTHPAVAVAKGYALYRRARQEPQPQRLATLTPTQTRYIDQTAKPGTLYIYSLSALGTAQESPRTPEISARR